MGRKWILFTAAFLFIACAVKADCIFAEDTSGYIQAVTYEPISVSTSKTVWYNIYYELDGGENPDTVKTRYTTWSLPVRLPIPEKENYNFAGWYLDCDYTEKVTEIDSMDYGNVTLYAKWTPVIDNVYNVQTYNYTTIKLLADQTELELRDCDYSFLDMIDIPGMPSTREMDSMQKRITDANQCPQGICMTEKYVLITSYCVEKDYPGCMYVFDKEDGEYLFTMGMKKGSHLGGIAFDGDNVWVCHSDDNTIERISYDYIEELAEEKPGEVIDCSEDIEAFEVNNRPSCITAYAGKLMIATQTAFWNSRMKSYIYEDGTLTEEATYNIPNKVQGVAFDEEGRVYLSTSYGRTRSSYLKVYANLTELNQAPGEPRLKIEMPPCSEEIDVEDGYLYVLFESAGYKYYEGLDGNGTAEAPLDKILTISLSSM